jgi:hypothetical protein
MKVATLASEPLLVDEVSLRGEDQLQRSIHLKGFC